MSRRGRYYLGRVIMLDRLDKDRFIEAIKSPATVHFGKFGWTVTDVSLGDDGGILRYVYGQLSKFSPEGIVRTVDDSKKTQGEVIEPNLLIASSPFIYIPDLSGIAYLHVWNQIERDTFIKRFCEVIRKTYDYFFVDCSIEPITDLRHFAERLSSIDRFLEISAKVHPPNPLFGRAWKSLNDYIKKRMASELNIKEKGEEERPLQSKLVEHVKGLLDQENGFTYEPVEQVDISDAAILMAADGYGSGKVVGKEADSTVTVRTTETHKSFLFSASPTPSDLFEEVLKHFKKLQKDRGMDHNEEDN